MIFFFGRILLLFGRKPEILEWNDPRQRPRENDLDPANWGDQAWTDMK